MGLLVTVFLVIINIFIGVKNQSPATTGLNAADVFLVVCIGQVFIALIEYAMVLIKYGQTMEDYQSVSISPTQVYTETSNEKDGAIATNHQNTKDSREISRQMRYSNAKRNFLDRLALLLFPISFLIFLIIYSITYVI